MLSRCMSLKRCSSMGVRTLSAMRANGARQLAKAAAGVARLDAIDGRAQRAGILNGLRQNMELRAERHDLGAIGGLREPAPKALHAWRRPAASPRAC